MMEKRCRKRWTLLWDTIWRVNSRFSQQIKKSDFSFVFCFFYQLFFNFWIVFWTQVSFFGLLSYIFHLFPVLSFLKGSDTQSSTLGPALCMLRYEVWWYADLPDRLMAAGLTVKKAAQHISRHSRKVSAAGALARTLPLFILLIYLWVQCCELTPPVKSLDSTVSFYTVDKYWAPSSEIHKHTQDITGDWLSQGGGVWVCRGLAHEWG